jgi:hypothetical protein
MSNKPQKRDYTFIPSSKKKESPTNERNFWLEGRNENDNALQTN